MLGDAGAIAIAIISTPGAMPTLAGVHDAAPSMLL
jgi:hypothetical protein